MYRIVAAALLITAVLAELSPEQHMTMQDVCGALPGKPDALGHVDDETMSKLTPHLQTVCQIYHNRFLNVDLDDDLFKSVGKRAVQFNLEELMKNSPVLAASVKDFLQSLPSHKADAVGKRGLLDGLLGDNSKLSTLLKAADALSKAKGVFDEVKNLAPAVHQHLQGSIDDITNNLHELVDSIHNEFSGKTTPSY